MKLSNVNDLAVKKKRSVLRTILIVLTFLPAWHLMCRDLFNLSATYAMGGTAFNTKNALPYPSAVIDFAATAYCEKGITKSGVPVAEGIVAAETMAGRPTVPVNRDQVPGCTYCDPEVASIGLTEAKAKERGYAIKTGKFLFGVLAKTAMEPSPEGFVKIVSEAKYDEILGVHIVGPHATELIAEGGALLRLEATTEEMIRTIHAHPTLSEALHEAAEAVHGQNIHG